MENNEKENGDRNVGNNIFGAHFMGMILSDDNVAYE